MKDSCPPTVVYVYACNYRFKMALSQLLEAEGLYTSDVEALLRENCCSSADDLAYAFDGNEQLMSIAPFMAEAWCLAAGTRATTSISQDEPAPCDASC